VVPGQAVLEIGPGRGVLTRPLLAAGARVVAVEIDPDLVERFPPALLERLALIHADFLDLDLSALPAGPMAVVANLPYSSGTAIVERLLCEPSRFTRLTVMLQKEVAERLGARPGSRSYGALSVLTALRAHPTLLFEVPPEAFRPPPKVYSAVVRLDVFPEIRTDVPDPGFFARVVHGAFSQRRKTLRNSMRAAFGAAGPAALEAAGIDPSRRAETLALEEFVELAREVGSLA
jgi:16S rRNA (adenine1518-N6/adenine1519-N6)-dimethyltransferase